MKHLILTVSLLTATCSTQAAEQKFFPNWLECDNARSAVLMSAGGIAALTHNAMHNREAGIEYKDRMLSFKCHVPYSYGSVEKPYVLIESRQELRDRINSELQAVFVRLEVERARREKQADLLIGIK